MNSDLEQHRDETYQRAATDPLTGLHNRQYIVDAIDRDTRRARRYGTPVACLMIDLDGFKELNDEHGHLLGDSVLRRVAETIAASVREIDVAARYGGDEFCILAPATGREGAVQLAERLRSAISGIDVVDGLLLTLTASVGVFSPTTMSQFRATTMIDCAEVALRKAKLTGNKVCAYSAPYAGVA